jgi:hypothetical protein
MLLRMQLLPKVKCFCCYCKELQEPLLSEPLQRAAGIQEPLLSEPLQCGSSAAPGLTSSATALSLSGLAMQVPARMQEGRRSAGETCSTLTALQLLLTCWLCMSCVVPLTRVAGEIGVMMTCGISIDTAYVHCRCFQYHFEQAKAVPM